MIMSFVIEKVGQLGQTISTLKNLFEEVVGFWSKCWLADSRSARTPWRSSQRPSATMG